MNVFLTFDYELFFGSETGTVEKCMIEPTEKLLQIAAKHQIPMTFFVDVGLLLAIEKFTAQFPILQKDYDQIVSQIHRIISAGSSVQLHIHPHWEKAIFNGEKWLIDPKGCYKLSDFPPQEIEMIVRKYKFCLDKITGQNSNTFRAGGWCIQPFYLLQAVFQELELKYDSSVFPGGHFEAGEYVFDFRNAPKESQYKFQNDVCVADENGFFTEFPIGSFRYSPLFYWRLYILGRLNPAAHKMVGDGIFMSQPGRKKQVLTHFTWNHASTDGFYATKMKTITQISLKKGNQNLVFIGHPKSCTLFSFKKLDDYVASTKSTCNFTTFADCP